MDAYTWELDVVKSLLKKSKRKAMNAKEARKEAELNQITSTEAKKQIENAVKFGNTSCIFNGKQMKDSAALELMQEGYKISKHLDPTIGIEYYKADW